MDNYIIKKNEVTNGLWTKFEFNGRQYYADLSYIRFSGYTECMIFDRTNLTNRDIGEEVFRRVNIPISESALRKCINDFQQGNTGLTFTFTKKQ